MWNSVVEEESVSWRYRSRDVLIFILFFFLFLRRIFIRNDFFFFLVYRYFVVVLNILLKFLLDFFSFFSMIYAYVI